MNLYEKMDNIYRGMREYKITEEIIIKTEKHLKNTMKLLRDVKLSVSPSSDLFEFHIIFQTRSSIEGLVDKIKDYIERDHQDGVKISRRYADVTTFR